MKRIFILFVFVFISTACETITSRPTDQSQDRKDHMSRSPSVQRLVERY